MQACVALQGQRELLKRASETNMQIEVHANMNASYLYAL